MQINEGASGKVSEQLTPHGSGDGWKNIHVVIKYDQPMATGTWIEDVSKTAAICNVEDIDININQNYWFPFSFLSNFSGSFLLALVYSHLCADSPF